MDPTQIDPARARLYMNAGFIANLRQTLGMPGVPTQAFTDQPTFSPQALLTVDAENAPRRVGAAVGGFVVAMIITALIAKRS